MQFISEKNLKFNRIRGLDYENEIKDFYSKDGAQELQKFKEFIETVDLESGKAREQLY